MYIIHFYFQGCLDRGPYSTNRIYTCGFCDFNWPILDLFYLKEDIISAPSIDHHTCYYNECQYKIDYLHLSLHVGYSDSVGVGKLLVVVPGATVLPQLRSKQFTSCQVTV